MADPVMQLPTPATGFQVPPAELLQQVINRCNFPDAKYSKDTTVGATTAIAGALTGARYVSAEYSAVGAAALTTRTAAQMVADLGANFYIGFSYTLLITNTSGGTTTLTAGTGVTLTGTMTMATNTTRLFIVTFTSATAVTFQSVGVGTIS